MSLLALVQAAMLGLTGHGGTRVLAIVFALISLNVRLRTLLAVAALIVINFGVHVAGLPSPIPYRLAHVAILAVYGAAGLATAAALLTGFSFRIAFAATAFLAVAFTAGEGAISRIAPPGVLGQAAAAGVLGADMADRSGEVSRPYAQFRSVYDDNPRQYFEKAGPGPGAGVSPGYAVSYSLNALGCRGPDYPIPNRHAKRRILVLGGGSALGVGVREPDTFAARLEKSLNARAEAGGMRAVEIINCGMAGAATRGQRLFYERILARYEPDVVLLAVSERDNLSRSEEMERGYSHQPARLEELFLSARLLQWAIHEGRRPFEYADLAREVVELDRSCRARGARLGVVFFRHAARNDHWTALIDSVNAATKDKGIPVRDLGVAILSGHEARDLLVHPTDFHPNEIAHSAAATEVEKFLGNEEFLR